jgi:hypothetical protein
MPTLQPQKQPVTKPSDPKVTTLQPAKQPVTKPAQS